MKRLVLLGLLFGSAVESSATYCSSLPVVALFSSDSSYTTDYGTNPEPSKERGLAYMKIWDRKDGANCVDTPPNVSTYVGIKVRGRSTLHIPKHQWSVKVYDVLDAETVQRAIVNRTMPHHHGRHEPLLGFPESQEFIFNAPWFAEAYAENYVGYHLARAMGRYASRSRFFEMMLVPSFDVHSEVSSEHYWGLYLLEEKIEPSSQRVDIHTMKKSDVAGTALTGGYIFAFDDPDADDKVISVPGFGTGQMVVKYPKSSDLQPQQQAYLAHSLNNLSQALRCDKSSGRHRRAITIEGHNYRGP